MKALAPLAILLALGVTPALAQTPAEQPAGAAASPSTASQPKVLNPSGGTKPEAAPKPAEPYAGQKPAAAPSPNAASPAATATPAPAEPTRATPAPDATADTEAKAKSEPVPDGPAVKPIAKPADNAPPAAATAPDATPTVAAAAKPVPPKPTLLVGIDLTNQKLSVTENGVAKYTWRISSGRTGYQTPRGTFRPVWMTKMWYSRKYDYAPMPHSIFFHGGTAIHGTDSLGALGRPASHGCVRLAPQNAAVLYRLVTQHTKQKTQIKVFGTPPKQPAMASREDRYRPTTYADRRYRDLPPWFDDDEDMPPPPVRRRHYSDRYYDAPRFAYPRRSRRIYRDDYDDFDY